MKQWYNNSLFSKLEYNNKFKTQLICKIEMSKPILLTKDYL